MLVLVRLLGVFMALSGIVLVSSPKVFRKVISYFKKDKRIYWAGVLRVVFGAILLIASPQCRWTVFTVVLGILFVAAGAFIFTIGIKKTKKILNMWEKKLGAMMPLVGLIPITFGILIVFAA